MSEGKARLQTLARALRGELPEGFRWNYAQILVQKPCETVGCAYGLATTIWVDDLGQTVSTACGEFNSGQAAGFFEMSFYDFKRIFERPSLYGKDWHYVKPADVAQAIEFYLKYGHTEGFKLKKERK